MNNELSGLFVPSVIDFAALVIVLLNAYFGFRRGLSGEVAHFLVLILGTITTIYLLHPVGSLFFRYATPLIPESGRYAFAFVGTAVVAATVMLILYRPIYNLFDRDALKHRNKPGGLVAGLLYGIVGVTFILVFLNLWPSPAVAKVVGDSSFTGRAANKVVPAVKRLVGSHDWVAGRTEVPGSRVIDTLRKEKSDRKRVTK